ncbi:hypothetical protein [Streptomyces sp. NPDC055056]
MSRRWRAAGRFWDLTAGGTALVVLHRLDSHGLLEARTDGDVEGGARPSGES